MADLPPILTGHETYLGDGLYASYDGYQFKLRADGERFVYLEAGVIDAFEAFVKRVREAVARLRGGGDAEAASDE